MPGRNPKALRAAIAEHTPQLLDDFDRHWKRAIADTYDLAPVPAFLARWWTEFALARDPRLDRRVLELEAKAAEADDNEAATALLEEAAHLRREAGKAEPVEPSRSTVPDGADIACFDHGRGRLRYTFVRRSVARRPADHRRRGLLAVGRHIDKDAVEC